MKPSVEIVMATYNGMPFIREQLLSILWQDYRDIKLLVHDDGSTDGTIDELLRVTEQFGSKVSYLDDGVTFKDPKFNFAHLLSVCDSDVIFLADQDDVWLPTKVTEMLSRLNELENTYSKRCPILIFSDYAVVDDSFHCLSPSLSETWHVSENSLTLSLFLTMNVVPGCSMCFNKALLDYALPVPEEAFMHDWWLVLVAAATGIISFTPKVLTLYRQHQNNFIGITRPSFGSSLARYIETPAKALKSFKALGNNCIEQAWALLERLQEKGATNSAMYAEIQQYLEYRTGNILDKVKYVRKFSTGDYLKDLLRLLIWR